MEEFISVLVYWVAVPAIMLALFVFARKIVLKAPNPESKTSAKAGFWAGLIIFVIFVISQMHNLAQPQFDPLQLAGIAFWPTLFGAILGFTLLFVVGWLLPTPRVGFIVLILAATSTSSFYSYLFISDIRNGILSLTLGVGLGALLHIVVRPTSVRELF